MKYKYIVGIPDLLYYLHMHLSASVYKWSFMLRLHVANCCFLAVEMHEMY